MARRLTIALWPLIVLVLVAVILLVANSFPAVGFFVDAAFFQLILTVVVCFVIAFMLFAFLRGNTAKLGLPPAGATAINLGGPIAGFVALLLVILPNLTPTARLTLYLKDEVSGEPVTLPNPVVVELQTDEGPLTRSVDAYAQFGFLPKGADLPITLRSASWGLASITPAACAADGSASGFAIKAGCRTAWLEIKARALFTGIPDLPAVAIGFPDGAQVSLRQTLGAFIDQLQKAATARDPNVPLGLDWSINDETAVATFPWNEKALSGDARACAVAGVIELAFNLEHRDTAVDIVVEKKRISVKPRDGKRENDACPH